MPWLPAGLGSPSSSRAEWRPMDMAVLEGRCWAAGGGAAALGLCECELIFDLEAARTSCRLGRNFYKCSDAACQARRSFRNERASRRVKAAWVGVCVFGTQHVTRSGQKRLCNDGGLCSALRFAAFFLGLGWLVRRCEVECGGCHLTGTLALAGERCLSNST